MIAYAATTAVNNISEGTTSQLASLIALIITKIPLWIAAFIVIVFTFILAKIARSIVENKMAEKGLEEDHKEVQALGGRVTYMTVLTIGSTVGLKIAGIDLTTIIAAVGFGVGFALKDLIMNFISGVMIIVGRQFTVGDFINIGGILGKVMEIQSRVTILRAVDGTKVIVPNSELFSKTITSYTSNPFRRIEIKAAVDYRGDLEHAIKICMHAIKHTKKVLLEPKPVVLIGGFGASNIDLKVRVWVESRSAWLKTKSNLMINIKKAYEKYNVPLAWNVTQLIMDKDLPIDDPKFPEAEKQLESAVVKDSKPAPVAPAAPTATVSQKVEVVDKPLKPLGEIR